MWYRKEKRLGNIQLEEEGKWNKDVASEKVNWSEGVKEEVAKALEEDESKKPMLGRNGLTMGMKATSMNDA